MTSVPATEAFTAGNWRRASTVALMMNGMYERRWPEAASNSARFLARMRATRVRSTSKTDVTCADVRRDSTMWSLISARIFDIGSTTSPGQASGSGPSAATCGTAGRPTTGGFAARLAIKPSMSRFVTRPAIPEPLNDPSSIPCSAAILRTRGDDLVRTRSSNDAPLPLPTAAGAAATDLAATAGAGVAAGVPAGAPAGAPAGTAAGTAADTSVSMRATTVWTATVEPSPTRISVSRPADGDGISASTLSVEI